MSSFGRNAARAFGLPSWSEEPLLIRALLILSSVLSLLLILGARSLVSFFMLSEGTLAHGEVWRLFTYSLPHAGLWHLFFNFLVLWMFAPALEESLGKVRFTVLVTLAVAAGGAAHILASPAFVLGLSAAVYAVLLYSAWLWPQRKILVFFVFPMPLALFVLILAGMEFLLSLQGGGTTSHWAHLGGLAAGMLLALLWGRGGARSQNPQRDASPRGMGASGGSNVLERMHGARQSASPRAKSAGWLGKLRERIGFYFWKRRLAKRNAEAARVDALLDKVLKQGIASLSAGERRFLERGGKK